MLYQSFYAQDDILWENNRSFKISPFLTNKEALTALCSVRCKARTTGSGQNTKEVQRGTRDVVECFYLLLEWQNRIELSQDFLICFMNINNPLNSHTFLFNFQNFFFFKAKECRQHVLYSHKARFCNKSECTLYLNFIINAKQKRIDNTYNNNNNKFISN